MISELVNCRRIPLLDLPAQHARIREEVLAELLRVIDTQKFILGTEVEALENELAPYAGARRAVACASGSDALFLALLSLGIGPGDRVITTPYTFFATAGAISRLQAIPVFVDIDASTFNLDVTRLPEAFAKHSGVRAVIPVHLFGGCVDMDPLLSIAEEHGCAVIEDAAQAIGAEYKSRRAGSMGHVACFSFFPSKNLGAFGDGGMLTTSDESVAARLKALRIHGRTGKYLHEWIGINSRLDALQAAVLRVKFRHLDAWTQARQQNAKQYGQILGIMRPPLTLPQPTPYQTRHVYNQFVIRCPRRDELRTHLQDHGIGTEVYYPLPLHLQPCFSDLGYKQGEFPASERLASEALALPVYPELTTSDIEYVCESLQSFYR